MTTDTKVSELPAKWRAKAKRIRGITAGSDLAADIMEGSAEDLEAALARQEADKTAASVGQTYAEDYPEHSRTSCSDANPCNADPNGSGCARCTALLMDRANAAPPSAPVGQEWTDEQCIEFASCAFRHAPRNPPDGVELADIRMAASRVMRSTPPAAQAVDLEQFRGAVEAYKAAVNEDCYFDPSDYDDNIAYADRLLALIDQQAGKWGA